MFSSVMDGHVLSPAEWQPWLPAYIQWAGEHRHPGTESVSFSGLLGENKVKQS